MPSGVYVDVRLQTADDGPGTLGSGDDGKVLAWDNGTSNFVMATGGGGGGVSLSADNHFSKPNDIVIDWFSGLGGSLIACEWHGRQCRSIELNAGYVAITLQRFADSTGQTPVLIDS